MPKSLDPNHLALMVAVRDAVDDLRKINSKLRKCGKIFSSSDPDEDVTALHRQLTYVIDKLRLTLKGRI